MNAGSLPTFPGASSIRCWTVDNSSKTALAWSTFPFLGQYASQVEHHAQTDQRSPVRKTQAAPVRRFANRFSASAWLPWRTCMPPIVIIASCLVFLTSTRRIHIQDLFVKSSGPQDIDQRLALTPQSCPTFYAVGGAVVRRMSREDKCRRQRGLQTRK